VADKVQTLNTKMKSLSVVQARFQQYRPWQQECDDALTWVVDSGASFHIP
jgi:hypothetical protein